MTDNQPLPSSGRLNARLGRAVPLALVVLFLLLARISWLTWGDVYNDTGYDLTAAWKVSEGQVLYRDLGYNYGPVAPYLNALALELFGLELWCFVACGFVSLILAAFLIHRISRLFLGPIASGAVVALFFLECGFAHYTSNNVFNFILPYTFSATYGTIAALAGFLFFARHLETSARRPLALSGAMAGVAALCKVEIGGAIAGTIGLVCLIRSLRPRFRAGAVLRDALTAGGPFLLVVALGMLPFVMAASAEQVFLRNIVKPELVNVGSNPFLLRMAGILDPAASFDQLFRSTAAWIVVLALVFAGSAIFGRAGAVPPREQRVRWAIAFVTAGLGIAHAFRAFDVGNEFRHLPVLCAATFVGALVPAWRARREWNAFELRCAALAIFALASLSRTLLQVWPLLYGFYTLVPGLVLFAVFLLRLLPRWLARARPHEGFLSAALVILLLGLSVRNFVAHSLPRYRLHTLEIGGAGGRMKILSSKSNESVGRALDYLVEHRGEIGSLVVIPGGVVNFLALIPSPIYQNLFNPIELQASGVEMGVVRDLREKAVDWILIIDFPMTEFGYKGFGIDYGIRLMRTIEREYRFHAAFGPSGYGCVLYRRK